MTTSRLLNQVADSTAHRDRDELDRAIARLLQQFLSARAIALYRLVDDGQGVSRIARRIAVTRDYGEVGPEDMEDTSKLPVLSDRPTWEDCIERNECVQWKQNDGACVAAFPIRSERMVVGVLIVEAETPVVTRDAELINGIMRIAENHLALLDYGERDTLTGLLNRKTFESQFRKLTQRKGTTAEPNPEPSWLALLDIDHFKSINDKHGHLYGDEILLLISQLMKRNFRGADQLYRFGGEEFLIVLDRATQAGAQVAFERLRASVEEFRFPQVGRVTISLGWTLIGPHDVPTTCVERADAALYYAKNHGRNNVRHFEALVVTGELIAKEDSKDVELF
jgi:diguanylate cyclase (GGDEF)-like protein